MPQSSSHPFLLDPVRQGTSLMQTLLANQLGHPPVGKGPPLVSFHVLLGHFLTEIVTVDRPVGSGSSLSEPGCRRQASQPLDTASGHSFGPLTVRNMFNVSAVCVNPRAPSYVICTELDCRGQGSAVVGFQGGKGHMTETITPSWPGRCWLSFDHFPRTGFLPRTAFFTRLNVWPEMAVF